MRRSRILTELLLIGAGVAVGVVVAQALVVRSYGIPSDSMEPTLAAGQRVVVSRIAYRFADPSPGDIVVFHPPAGAVGGRPRCGAEHTRREACPRPTAERADDTFIKRVVARPGDRLAVRRGRPIVNGRPLPEPFATLPCRPPGLCDLPDEIVIPPRHYFMMGDGRGGSVDSRHWGPVPRAWLIGEAVLTY